MGRWKLRRIVTLDVRSSHEIGAASRNSGRFGRVQ